MIIGITGPTGSGKSTVAAFLADKYKLFLIDADKLARAVTEKGTECIKELADSFGSEYLNPDGSLNRKKLGALVFSKSSALEKLNAITHKYIIAEIKDRVKENPDCIIDAPLLFETGLDTLCDKIILVTCGEKIRAERIMNRDKISFSDALSRINSQSDYSLYAPECHLNVINDGRDFKTQLTEVENWQKN